jgi:hypothetical protein
MNASRRALGECSTVIIGSVTHKKVKSRNGSGTHVR